MFDRLIVQCPRCDNSVEFQSKAGECILEDFVLENAPPNVLGDLHNESETCQNCGRVVTIIVQAIARVE